MSSASRGFTLIEMMTVVVIAGILASTTGWAIAKTLPGYRVGGAASRFLLDLRSASSIAAQHNRPVNFNVKVGEGGCALAYTVESGGRIYNDVCIDKVYPKVKIVSPTANVNCAGEAKLSMPDLPGCTLCSGGTITFLPTGEVYGTSADGDTLVFANASADDMSHHTRAVGIRYGLGKARIYRWRGSAWSCE